MVVVTLATSNFCFYIISRLQDNNTTNVQDSSLVGPFIDEYLASRFFVSVYS